MAEIRIDIKTIGHLQALTELQEKLEQLTKTAKSMNELVKSAQAMMRSMQNATKAAGSATAGINKTTSAVQKNVQAVKAAAVANQSLSSAMKRIGSMSGTVNSALQKQAQNTERMRQAEMSLANANGKLAQSIAEKTQAEVRYNSARKELERAQKTGDQRQIEQAAHQFAQAQNDKIAALQRYDLALAQSKIATKEFSQSQTALRASGQEISGLIGSIKQYRDVLKGLQTQAGKEGTMESVEQFQQMDKTLKSLQTSASRSMTTVREALDRTQSSATVANRTFGNLRSSVSPLQATFIQTGNAIQSILRPIQTVISQISRLSGVFSSVARGVGRGALSGIQIAFKGVGTAASGMYAMLQKSIQSSINLLRNFTTAVRNHMQQASQAMKQFYNAGWSLMMSGYSMKNFGDQIFSGLTGSLDEYMEYEKNLTRTAISAQADRGTIQELIFGLQRGDYGAPIKTVSAEEMAQGLYYYTSAIGKQIATPQDMEEVGKVVSEFMRVASVTQTSLDIVTKGIVNAALEFGIDPRQNQNADEIVKIADQMAYLANISTLEVPDILETFKYIGPMAHILSDRNTPGAGLEETMALTFFASEVGLRGGNAGRGVAQGLQTLLDPSGPALEAAAEAFGIEASEEAFRAFFFDAEGQLKGGLPGLFEKLGTIPEHEAAMFISKIFTTNATRSIVGIEQALRQGGGLQAIMDRVLEFEEGAPGGMSPTEWMAKAFADTNDTIFANFQYLKNAWFQLTAEIIASIEGPLKKALASLAHFFFQVAEIIKNNRWIGQLAVGIASVVAAISTAIGSFFMLGGAILLTMKAFSLLGGLLGPSIFFFASVIQAIALLTPLFLGLAAATVLVKKAWEDNFMGIQDRFKDFMQTLQDGFQWLSLNGALAAKAFAQVFEDRVFEGVQRLQRWMAENQGTVETIREVIRNLGTGIIRGFTTTLLTVVATIRTLMSAVASLSASLLKLFENVTNIDVTFQNLATTVGVVLGSVFALFLARHLLPTGIAITTLKAGVLGLTAAMYALQGAVFVVTRAWAAMTAVIGVIGAILGSLTTIGALVAASVMAAVLAMAGAFVYLMVTSQDFRNNVMTVVQAIINGFVPALKMMAVVAAAGFMVVTEIMKVFFEYLADHKEQVQQLAELIGIGLVAAFATFIVWIGAAVAAIALFTVAVIELLDYFRVLDFASAITDDLQVLAQYLSLENMNWGLIISGMAARIAQYGAYMAAAMSNALAEAISGSFGRLDKFFDEHDVVRTAFQSNPFTNLFVAAGEAAGDIDSFLRVPTDFFTTVGDTYGAIADDTYYVMNDAIENSKLGQTNVTAPPDIQKKVEEILSGNISAGQIVDQITAGLKSGGSMSSIFESVFGTDLAGTSLDDYTKILDVITSQTQTAADDTLAAYTQAKGTWDDFKLLSDALGPSAAAQIWHDRGMAVPTDPRSLPEWQATQDSIAAEQELAEMAKAAANARREANKKIVEAIPSMSLEDLMKAQFGTEFFNQPETTLPKKIKGGYGVSSAQAMTGYADQFLTNIQEAMPWMNQAEIFADLAGMGIAGKNVAGVNMRRVLRPLVEQWAAESGLAVDDILKDIPSFFAPEEYQAVALTELTGNLQKFFNSYGEAVYHQLDELGTQFDPRTGRVYEEHGIDWQELIDFGISKSMGGAGNLDWNLTDYLMQAWDITRGEAEAYIEQNGLDPDMVNQEWFAGVQMTINAQGGKVSVMSAKMWDWLMQQTKDGSDKVIEMTQEQFDALDDATKYGLTAQGFTVLIGGKQTNENFLANAKLLKNSIEDEYGDIPGAMERAIRDGQAQVSDPWVGEDGQDWVTVTFGDKEIKMPAVVYDEYKRTVQEIQRVTEELNKKRKELEEPVTVGDVEPPKKPADMAWKPPKGFGWGWSQADLGRDGAGGESPAYTTGKTAGDDMASGFQSSAIFDPALFPTSNFTSWGNLAGTAFKTAFETTAQVIPPTTSGPQQRPGDRNPQVGGAATQPLFIEAPTATANLDITEFLTNWQTAFTAGDALDKAIFEATLDGNPFEFNTAMASVSRWGEQFDRETYTATLAGDNVPFLNSWQAAYNAGAAFDNAVFSATLSADTAAFWNAINAIPVVVARRYVDVVQRDASLPTATPGLAVGGPALAGSEYLVGEEGPELFVPRTSGTVVTNERLSALMDVSPTSTSEFRNARQWNVKGNVNTGNVTTVQVDQVVIERNVDVDRQLDRLNRLIGKRNELNINRGQEPTQGSQSF